MIPRPPDDLRVGDTLIAGLSVATVLPDIDFETRSPAGHVWDGQTFVPPHGANAKGLRVVGTSVYSEHPGCEVLCMAYDLKDGFGSRTWKPGEPAPLDLFIHLQGGGLIEAWNSAFEFYIWNNVCVRRYNFPPLAIHSLRCAAAKSRAFSLPSSLEEAGRVLNIKNKKLAADGKRLIKRYCEPHKPTKANAGVWNELRDNPSDTVLMQQYNLVDIKAEAELSGQIPDLSPTELEFWLADQAINRRGVRMDRKAIENCIAIVEQAYEKYNSEIPALTNGAVTAVSQLARITKWMNSYGVFSKSLDEAHIDGLLKTLLPPQVHRVLQIRQLIGSAAVKKLYAMINRLSADGRMRDLFVYHTARTGRAGGEGVQPQNLPNNAWMRAWECATCGKHSAVEVCFWCGGLNTKEIEWNTLAIENALSIIATRNLSCVEMYFGEAIATVSGCLRGMFISAEGKDFVSSDYSSIEGICLAVLAGEEWRIEEFNGAGKIYERSASLISGVPLQEILQFRKETGKHHDLRKLGKVAELACLASDTQVLTSRGYVRITDVTKSDKVWDGVEWVHHKGVISKGLRHTIVMDGVTLTPNHPVSIGLKWRTAEEIVSQISTLNLALEIGSENLPLLMPMPVQKKAINWRTVNAPVATSRLRTSEIYEPEGLHVVNLAQKISIECQALKERKGILSTHVSFLNLRCVGDYFLGLVVRLADVIVKRMSAIITMVLEALVFVKNGEIQIGLNSLSMLSPSRVGITHYSTWIESTEKKDISQVISASSVDQKTCLIEEQYPTCKNELTNLKNVYDIVNAGPRNRFTIKTTSGHMLVHNSGYGGWLGSWLNFKADEFLTEEQIISSVKAWRNASPMIVKLWKETETCAHMAVLHPNQEFAYRTISYIRRGDVLYCRLPSGRHLTYHRPQIAPSSRRPGTMELSFEGWNSDGTKGPIGWTRMTTYGARLVENVVQAVARDILAHAIVQLEKRGYPVVLHVHDEIVCEIPEGWGSVAELESIMTTLPSWAADWPIRAAGGWRAKRYQK